MNPLNFVSGDWCLMQATVSTDVTACESLDVPAEAVEATGVGGSFAVDRDAVQLDVELTFPTDTGLPDTVRIEVANCVPDCELGDCRL